MSAAPLQLKRQADDARRLARLRALRLAAAERDLQCARASLAQQQQRVADRHAHIALVRRELHELAAQLAASAALPRVAAYAGPRREALADELERALVALADETDDLAEAERACARARAAWLHARGRDDAALHLAARARHALAGAAERRAEAETDPLPRQPTRGARA